MAPSEVGEYTLFSESESQGVRVGLMAPANVLGHPSLANAQIEFVDQAFVADARSLRTFRVTGVDGALEGALRVHVSWSGSDLAPVERLAVLANDGETWQSAPAVSRGEGELIVEASSLSRLVLVELGAEARFDSALPGGEWTQVSVDDAVIAEAAALEAGEKAAVSPQFFARTPLDTPLTGGEQVCIEYIMDALPPVRVHAPFASNKYLRAIAVNTPEDMLVRFIVSSSSACADELRAIFPDDGVQVSNPVATQMGSTPLTTCATDDGTVCGRYYLSLTATGKYAATNTGTLDCPGSAAFIASDANSNGIVDSCEGPPDLCPEDPLKTEPGVCGCGVEDTDSDSDGTPDCNDECPSWDGGTSPGPCGCSFEVPGVCGVCGAQPDFDSDGTPDCVDDCPWDFGGFNVCGTCGIAPDFDSDGTPDCLDECPVDFGGFNACGDCGPVVDGDLDGTPYCFDDCDGDPGKTEPGVCGCGVADTDTDLDGTADCVDECPDDPANDPDDDDVCEGVDNCPGVSNPGGYGAWDVGAYCAYWCDGFVNGSSYYGGPPGDMGDCLGECMGWTGCAVAIAHGAYVCPGYWSAWGFASEAACLETYDNPHCALSGQADGDDDGYGDACDECLGDDDSGDLDLDGVCDDTDGCDEDPDKVEPMVCGCGFAETDTDLDGTPDCVDECPLDYGGFNVCGECGIASDSDADGTPDCVDGCPGDPGKTEPGVCGCGEADTDSDTDGTPDCVDGCPGDPAKIEPGFCGCGTPDDDSDSDGYLDCEDACPGVPDPAHCDAPIFGMLFGHCLGVPLGTAAECAAALHCIGPIGGESGAATCPAI